MADQDLLVDFALQGGGAHGAFTWGVLDRALEEPGLRIEAISGTSAGAMNAAVVADGWAAGGADGARQALERYWRAVSDAALLSPLQRGPIDILLGEWTMDYNPLFVWADIASRVFSPYDFGPYELNPLRDILNRCIDFERLAASKMLVYVTATSVRTGKPRTFTNADVSADALLASGCLPQLFPAVVIDGEPYWDGGYSANPALRPLVFDCIASDTILVQINPIERPGVPRTARDILDRMNEISFNSALLKELRILALLRRAEIIGDEQAERWGRMRMHRISSDLMLELGYSSKLNAEWAFLTMLRDDGRRAADDFFRQHRSAIGQHGTLDFESLLE